MKKNLRLGTRGSPLALAQAELVREKLLSGPLAGVDGASVEIVPIRTTGDWRPEQKERTFLEMGGNKGLFTKEIEDALLEGSIDLAVHSMKDVPTEVPEGLAFSAMLERADPRDAFISHIAKTLQDLPAGARVGTASLRRQSQIKALRPDLQVMPLRGNVETRLRKLEAGEAEATILAVAGLARLGLLDRAASILDAPTMLPAVAQGAIGVEIRENDAEMRALMDAINHAPTMMCVTAERALLRVLDGSCRTPVAAYAQLRPEGRIMLEALVARPDGTGAIRLHSEGAASDAASLGATLGQELKGQLPADFFEPERAA